MSRWGEGERGGGLRVEGFFTHPVRATVESAGPHVEKNDGHNFSANALHIFLSDHNLIQLV